MDSPSTHLSLEEEFSLINTKNIQLKSKILGFVFLFLFVILVSGYIFKNSLPSFSKQVFESNYFLFIPSGVLIFLLFEWVGFLYFKKIHNEQKNISWFFVYTINILESAIPTFSIIFLGKIVEKSGVDTTSAFLDTPPMFAYFFFIILSSLQMNFWLCLAVGASVALQHLLLCIHYSPAISFDHVAPLNLRIGRTLIFLVGGILTGIVSQKIKESVLASLKSKNDLIFNLDHLVRERTQEIVEQKNQIMTQNNLLNEKNNNIEEKQKEILDSINYAKRIQYTLLAHQEVLEKNLPEHFILFEPKDIVSGDFYWATEKSSSGQRQDVGKNDLFYFAVCDSTGHGVPGAFMSLLNISFLNEAINEKNISSPEKILNYVRDRLVNSVSQEGAQDGMDGILLCFDKRTNTISYSSSHNSPVYIRNGELIELPSDKMPIGKGEIAETFSLHQAVLQPGDLFYLYTDGFADQFGGPKGKKFKYKQLKKLLLSISNLPIEEQKNQLSKTFTEWKGDLEQVDDVCMVGMRV